MKFRILFTALVLLVRAHVARAQQVASPAASVHNDSVTVNFADADVRLVVQALAPYLEHPVVFGSIPAIRLTLQTPQPVPRAEVGRLLRGVLESQNMEIALDTAAALYRVRQKQSVPPPAVRPQGYGAGAAVGSPELHVIQLQHARASEVAATVNALYGKTSALGEGEIGRGAGPTFPQSLAETQNSGTSQQLPTSSSRAAVLSGDAVIIPDATTNTLLVRANEHDYDLIDGAVKQLDVRPLQVLIEVLIAEVSRNSRFALGIGTQVPESQVRGGPLDGATVGGITGNGPAADSSLGDFVLRVLKKGSGVNFTATITAAQARGEANILSRPVLIAANGETASILVGSQRPFIQVQRSLPTETATRDQIVQYKDVGTKLTVKPTISADGYVMLNVTQEVNQATSEVQFDAPVISTRTLQTQLLVRDSQTVVLGGISDRQRDDGRSGIPLLSRIPVIGALFGQTSRQANQTEFFLFITPHIIRTDADADKVSAPLRQRSGEDQH